MATMKNRGDKRKAKKTLRIPNLYGVEGKRPLAPEGRYLVKVKEVSSQEGDAGEYYKWIFEKADGKQKGSLIYHNTSLSENSLWNLRGLLESLGVEIEDDEMDLEIEDLVGVEMIAEVNHEKSEGFRTQARLVDHAPADEEEQEEEAEEEKEERKPRGKKRGGDKEEHKPSKKKKKSEPDFPDADAIRDMDEDELTELVSEHELEVDLDDFPTLKKKKAAVIDAATEAGLIE